MLSREDMEFLCRVGPGTPMGDLMRQYWMPVSYTGSWSRMDSQSACGSSART